MRKKLTLIGLVVSLITAGWLSVSGLKECAWLDRLFRRSGCIGNIAITAGGLPRGGAMTVPDEHGVSSLFGDVETVDGWRPRMIRIDPLTGQEFGRFTLRMQNGLDAMEPAADGKRAVLYCALRQRCTQGGHNTLIVSLADGPELRQMDYDRYNSGSAFPSDPTPGKKFHFGAGFGDGGRTVISLDDEKILRLSRSDGERIAVLSRTQDRYKPHAPALIVSPIDHDGV